MMLLAFERYHHIQYYKDGQSRPAIAHLNNMGCALTSSLKDHG
jgi:hypothetical protein